MDAELEHFRVDVNGGIAWGTFNRPRSLNAFSIEMREGIINFLERAEHDPSVRCIVLRGAGEHFMAGGDVKDFTRQFAENSPAERRAFFEATCHAMHPIVYRLQRMPKPVLTSVRGACAGLGLSLVLGSDLSLCARSAVFTLAYTRIGTSPDGGATYFLPRVVGMKQAMEIALLSERFDAETALRYGIVNWLVDDDEIEAETEKIAQKLAAGATHAMARTKSLLVNSLSRDLEAQLQAEAVSFGACSATEEMAEGVAAFIEKRPPNFDKS